MTREQILEIVEKYKLRMPPTAFYELKADIVNFEEPTTKNNLGVDAVSRAEVLKLMQDNWHTHNGDWAMQESMDDIRALPSITPQEPFKPMVEIDLDYVIKQKYIEREVLDKIRAEIEPKCDRINSLASVLSYTSHREIQELLCEIMDLCKAESEET